jgi:hypothetical protein
MGESKKHDDQPGNPLTGRETYNVVSDTVTGANVRLKDNLYQGVAVFVCAAIGAAAGYYLTVETLLGGWIGAGLGAASGMLVGVVASGIFLMVYRGIRHVRGRHD